MSDDQHIYFSYLSLQWPRIIHNHTLSGDGMSMAKHQYLSGKEINVARKASCFKVGLNNACDSSESTEILKIKDKIGAGNETRTKKGDSR